MNDDDVAGYDEPPDDEGDEALLERMGRIRRTTMEDEKKATNDKPTDPLITPAAPAVELGTPEPAPAPIPGELGRLERFGRAGYEAYSRFTGGKTYDGKAMPTWDNLPLGIRFAWCAASTGIFVEASR